MNLICEQSRFLHAAARAKKELPDVEGDFFFLGISGRIEEVWGGNVMPFKERIEKCRGIVLYLDDTRFKAEKARDLTENIKFFIDGIERVLQRNVLILGCPVDQAKTAERYILNEDRWPNPTPSKVEIGNSTILEENSESKGDSKT